MAEEIPLPLSEDSCNLEQTSAMINDCRRMAAIIYYTGAKRSNVESKRVLFLIL